MRVIHTILKITKKLIAKIKPKQELTYEKFHNLEQKKARPSELKIRQHNAGADGVSHDPRHRLW